MAMVAMIDDAEAEHQAQPTRSIATVEIFTDLNVVEPLWRAVEAGDTLTTPYQVFDLQATWMEHVGPHEAMTPFVVVAFDTDKKPLLVWPLAVRQENGVSVAQCMGGKHITFNMALWDRQFALTATRSDLDTLIARLKAHADRPDVLAISRQPRVWRDVANPMALLPHQNSINDCPLLTLVPGEPAVNRISNSFRRRLKGKERKLQVLPGYRSFIAKEDTEINRVLDAFFQLKPLRMAEQNLPNVFADPGIEPFIREACLARSPTGERAIAIHALECDEEVIAMFAGVADGHRFSMMFNTYTLSANAKFSPGLILMRDIIDHYAEAGYTSLDLGIGADDYKRLFCKDEQAIFDSFLPLTTRGAIAAVGLSSLTHAKRLVKQTPALMQMTQMLRNAFRR
jgi:CelD/BcsL family acetyltransferase involved in cellulose biosynthesis